MAWPGCQVRNLGRGLRIQLDLARVHGQWDLAVSEREVNLSVTECWAVREDILVSIDGSPGRTHMRDQT